MSSALRQVIEKPELFSSIFYTFSKNPILYQYLEALSAPGHMKNRKKRGGEDGRLQDRKCILGVRRFTFPQILLELSLLLEGLLILIIPRPVA